MNRKFRFLIRRKGFTLVETLVAICVFTLICAGVSASIIMLYRTQIYASEQAIAINEARRSVEIMAQEIRKARYGDNGAYPIEKAAGKEFVFYSDIDKDGATEKVRYFLALVRSGSQSQECVSTTRGGVCSVSFANFLTGNLKSAQVRVLTEGYYGVPTRYAQFYADASKLGDICKSDCSQCAGAWQGTQTYDVTAAAADGVIQFTMDSDYNCRAQCQWVEADHSMKARFEFSWVEEVADLGTELKKTVIEPTGNPVTYPESQGQTSVISYYVRNVPPIFTYFDASGQQITSDPAILRDTKMMRLFMVVNVTPARAPDDYELEQYVHLRNLREE